MEENPIKYSDLFQDDGALDALIKKIKELDSIYSKASQSIRDEFKKTQDAAKNLNIVNPDSSKQIAELEAKVASLNTKLKENKEVKSQLQKLEEQSIRLKTEEAKKEQELKLAIQGQTQALKNEIIVEKQQQGSLKQLEAQLRQNIDKYKSMSAAERDSTKAGKDLNATIQKQDAEVKKLNESIGRSQGNVGNYAKAFQGLGRTLGALGIATGITAVFQVIKSSVGIFSDFEKANSNLNAVLGITKEQAKSLVAEAKALGASTSFTATEVTGLQTELGKLGFPIDDIHAMTASILDGAAAMGSGLGETATLVGSALQAFGLDASHATRVTDVLAKSTILTALDFEDLAQNLATVSPVAKAFGFTIEDTTALLGQLSNAGFDASSGATATRNILLNLADSNGKLAKSLKEPVKDIPSLVKGLKQLKNEGIDLASALELTDVRSVGAFNTFLEGADSIQTMTLALQDAKGTAQEMADKQLDNLSGSVKLLSSAWEGFILGIEEGDGLLNGFLRGIVDGTTKLLGFFTSTEKVSESLEKERTNIFAAKAELMSINTTTERRIELINDLKTQYPDLLKNIDAETVSNKDLNLALEAVNKSLIQKIVIQKKEEQIQEQAARAAEAQIKFAEAQKRLLDATGVSEKEAIDKKVKGLEAIQKAEMDEIKRAETLLNILDTRGNVQKALSQNQSVFASNQAQRNSTEKLADAIQALKNRKALLAIEEAALNDLIKDQINLQKESSKVIVEEIKEEIEENIVKLGLLSEIAEKTKKLNEEQQATNSPERILQINKEVKALDKKRDALLGVLQAQIDAENIKLSDQQEKLTQDAIVRDIKNEEEKLITQAQINAEHRIREVNLSIGSEIKKAEIIRLINEQLIIDIEQIEENARKKRFDLNKEGLKELKALQVENIIDEKKTEQEKEIAAYNFAKTLRKQAIKDKKYEADLEAALLAEIDKKALKDEAAINKKYEDEKKAKNKARIKEQTDFLVNMTIDALERIAQAEEDKIQKKIDAQNNQIEKQQELAMQGAENTLAFEEAQLAKLENQKLEAQKKLIQLEKIKALYSAYSSAASSGDNNAIVKVLTDFAIMQGIESSLQAFGDGTGEYGTIEDTLVKRGGIFRGDKHTAKSGGIPVMVEGGEGILSAQQMNALGRDNFMSLTKSLDGGSLSSDVFGGQVAMIPQRQTMVVDFSSLKAEINDVKKAIENKPVQQVNVENLRDSYLDIVETNIVANKRTISRYRVNKNRL